VFDFTVVYFDGILNRIIRHTPSYRPATRMFTVLVFKFGSVFITVSMQTINLSFVSVCLKK